MECKKEGREKKKEKRVGIFGTDARQRRIASCLMAVRTEGIKGLYSQPVVSIQFTKRN